MKSAKLAKEKFNTRDLLVDDYDNVIGFVASQAASGLAKVFANELTEAGLNLRPRDFPILNRLRQHGTLTQTEISDLTYKDRPAMTRSLDRLIDEGLVQKVTDSGDRRAFQVSLTDAGLAARNEAANVLSKMLDRICNGLSPDDLKITVSVLHHIIKHSL